MDYQDLLSSLLRDARFEDRDDAERALAVTLETLATTLPLGVVDKLRQALPPGCALTLAFGLRLRTSRRYAGDPDAPARMVAALPSFTIERIEAVGSAISPLLPPALIRELTTQLPARLMRMFVVRPQKRGLYGSSSRDASHEAPSFGRDARRDLAGVYAERRSATPFGPSPALARWDNSAGSDMDTRRLRRP